MKKKANHFVTVVLVLVLLAGLSLLLYPSVSEYWNSLHQTKAIATYAEEVANLNVHKFLAGALGGAQQMCAQIENNELDLIIFLREPVSPRSHEPDVNNVVRLCDTHNIPLATNLATAELLIRALDRGDLDWREMYK